MKKDKKFLSSLEANLVGIKDKYKKEIISKYETIIKERKDNKEKITAILKSIGTPEDVAKSEIELLGSKANKSFFDKLKDKRQERKERRAEKKAQKKEKKNEKTATKEKKPFFAFLKKKDKVKKEKVKKEKVKKEKVKKEKKEKVKDPNKKTLKESLVAFKNAITKDISFKKKREVTDEPKEIIEEIQEEFEEEIPEVSEIVPEKKIFESRKTRAKRIILKTLGVIFTIILLFAWLWVTVVFLASVFAYLDGVKFKGLIIGLFGLDILVLWIVIMINRAIFRKAMSLRLNLIICIVSIALIALGIVLCLKDFSKIEKVEDVSIKYTMTTKLEKFELPSKPEQNFTLTFNSNYNTQYTINYDDNLKDVIKVEIKYYECYYDYYFKKISNGAYVSLKLDDRDRLAVYIDDLKEKKIFDNDELSRYSVKITISSKNANRLVIQN